MKELAERKRGDDSLTRDETKRERQCLIHKRKNNIQMKKMAKKGKYLKEKFFSKNYKTC